MIKHTHGPLTIDRIPDTLGSFYIRDATDSAIGAAYGGFVSRDGTTSIPSEANARLWAESPALLEACRIAVRFIKLDRLTSGNDPACNCNGCRTIRVLEAAIRRAEGMPS